MLHRHFSQGRVCVAEAWTGAEVRVAVGALLEAFEAVLPRRLDARIVIKPNLNNDLPALMGNAADLRVLDALLADLRRRGYRDLTLADGPNVGVARRGIDVFHRLRVDRLAARHGARLVDLNTDAGAPLPLPGGSSPRVARTWSDAEFRIGVPKIKTHIEMGLSCACKNQVGVCCGEAKRQMHDALARNIFALTERLPPHLVLVDGLVGMEGSGPGDGEPFRLGRLLAGNDPFVLDLAVCRLVGLPWREVPYLVCAEEAGRITPALAAEVAAGVPQGSAIRRAPPRPMLARIADHRRLRWLKRLARPATDRPEVAAFAKRLGVIQDVYAAESDGVTGLSRDTGACGTCRICEDFCPTALPLEEIGVNLSPDACIQCLYCWWVCPRGAIHLDGPLGQLEAQAARYKTAVESLAQLPAR